MKNILAIVVVLIVGYYLFSSNKSNSLPVEQRTNTIVLYSTKTCPYCAKARKQLEAGNVNFVEYFIDTDSIGAARYKELRARGVPVIEADGQVIHGYNQEIIATLIADDRYKKSSWNFNIN